MRGYTAGPFASLAVGPQRDAIGHLVQPGRQRLTPADGAGLADQQQERRLKCVVSVVRVAEDALAHAKDQTLVASHQQFEGDLIAAAEKSLEQLRVGHVFGRTCRLAQVLGDPGEAGLGHYGSAPGRRVSLQKYRATDRAGGFKVTRFFHRFVSCPFLLSRITRFDDPDEAVSSGCRRQGWYSKFRAPSF